MKSPSTASPKMTARQAAPMMNLALRNLRIRSARLRGADARIDQEIDDVDRYVDDDEQRRVGDHDARGERDVAHRDRLIEERPEPRPAEHNLDDDAAGNEHAELEPDDGDDRHRRVGE